jgi:putative transposase
MPNYRRYRVLGGTYFFTVNLLERYPNDLLIRPIEILCTVVRETRRRWLFHFDYYHINPVK